MNKAEALEVVKKLTRPALSAADLRSLTDRLRQGLKPGRSKGKQREQQTATRTARRL
jgi:hypothetical protein